MKICFLGPASSAHIEKWSKYFVANGHEVSVISFVPGDIAGATVYCIDTDVKGHSSDLKKIGYLFKYRRIQECVKKINPDIISAHYATSYGAVAALAGLKNYVLSLWGSDIYDFPRKSKVHRLLLQYSLKRATYIFSTSKAMAQEAGKYTNKQIEITPFGVDTELFSPEKRKRNDHDFVIGTVKSLSKKYGIDYLIKAVAIFRKKYPEIPIQLRIAGKGSGEDELRRLAVIEGVSDVTTWLGFISQEQAAFEWANFDVAVIPSISESFGVSAVEAQACCCPVIISDEPGLMEATKPNVTSVVVPRQNAEAISDAIYDLYLDRNKRVQMGRAGRRFVEENYEYLRCFGNIEDLFITIKKTNGTK